jgi:nitroreductase/NAD-dependent dihydropyrimidine dehydrogenase PreA subunit
MPLFTVDNKKCKRDGICVAECPPQIIVMPNKKDFPMQLPGAEEYCINCGHCVAVCPYGALTLSSMPFDDCPTINEEFLPQAGAVRELLKARRSIRQYKKKPISNKILAELIDTARFAPTGGNQQQVHWMVFEKTTDVQRLAGLVVDFMKLMLPAVTDEAMASRMRRIPDAWNAGRDRIMRGAPHLVLAHAPADLSPTDCVIALTYLELYAYAKGLGTCWAGYFMTAADMHKPLIEALGLPAGHRCFGAIMLGYPKYRYVRIPKRNPPLITWR